MPETVLVVDDDKVIQGVVTKLLREVFLEVLVAGDLAGARELLQSRPVSVVLADLMLPDGQGTELIDHARRVDERTHVIVLTSSAQTESVVEAIRLGAFDYLEKPIDRLRLLGVVEKALEERRKLDRNNPAVAPAHIMVVDDDPLLLKVMSNWLAQLGLVIHQASTLAEARQILEDSVIDMVVSDIFLEDGTGLELATEMRRRADHQPLILVTAARDAGTAVKALRDGAFDYLQKPLNREEFLSAVLRARQFREAEKSRHRLEREKEEYRVRLELLSANLEAKVKEQVDALKTAQSLAETVYRSLPSALIITDRDQRVTAVNPFAETLLNSPADLLVGKRVSEHHKLNSFATTVAEVLRAGKTYSELEAEVATQSGPPRLLGYTVAPLIDSQSGVLVGAVLHIMDLTARRQLEEYKQQSERLVSLGMMAGGMAHEINNPLTIIIGWLEHVLEQTTMTKPVDAALRKCLHAAIRCGELVSTMLNLSRRTQSKLGRVDLHGALRRVSGLVEKQLALHHVDLITQLAATQASVTGDERELEQLFLNLFINARDAMPHGGTLFVSTKNESDELIVNMADTGLGIPKERLPHLFTPFFTTKEVGKGTGLGLAICLAIVERHRGRIDASSEVGRGTTITVALPVTASLSEPAPTPAGPLPELPTLRIAVVDDEPAILELCTETLKSVGHIVQSFLSPVECLEWLAANPVDLVVMDVKMPTMDGVELYQRVKAMAPTTLVLFVTGSVVGNSLEHLRNQDPRMGVLRKPFRREQLLRGLVGLFRPEHRFYMLTPLPVDPL